MDVQTELPSTLPEPAATSQPQMSVSEAARALAQARYSKEPAADSSPNAGSGAPVPSQEPPQSTTQVEDAAPAEQQATGETQETDPSEGTLIEPPRSWSKDARDRWSKLDPDTQAYLLERDSEDSAAVRKAQNDAAEQRKAFEAKQQAAEQARQKYETTLPVILQSAQQQILADFPDVLQAVQTGTLDAYVEQLIRDEPQRHALLRHRLDKMQALHGQMAEAAQRQTTEKQEKFGDFAKEQDRLFAEKAPEMRSDKAAKELRDQSLETLKAIGFSEDELGKAWSGGDFSLRDHRVQLLIRDATLWRDAQAKAKSKTTQAKSVPPVQRPGTSRPAGADNAAQVQQLEAQLDSGKLTVRQQLEVAAKLRSIRGTLIARKAS